MAGLFQVLYGKPDGKFGKAEVLNGTDGKPLIIPADREHIVDAICTRPFAVDWNGDGHLDLVVGNFKGTFYWFRGEGKGAFHPEPEPIRLGAELLHIQGYHSDPFAIDWDGDGDLDLVSGSAQGGVQWAENVAGAGKLPELRAFQWLIKPVQESQKGEDEEPQDIDVVTEDGLTGPTKSTRVWVADVNGDGKLDLLVGDSLTLIAPADGLTVAAMKQKSAEWKKRYAAAVKELEAAQDDEQRSKVQEKFSKIYEQRTEFLKEDDTGFVWLYLQK
ncbi:MAG: VCBS repeat-containing protein [Planctomycetes bacterium]|nr:VCBS repeat-containing protein [Planctomycetota bacterium]